MFQDNNVAIYNLQHLYSIMYTVSDTIRQNAIYTQYAVQYYFIRINKTLCNMKLVFLLGHHITPMYIPYRAAYVKINVCLSFACSSIQ